MNLKTKLVSGSLVIALSFASPSLLLAQQASPPANSQNVPAAQQPNPSQGGSQQNGLPNASDSVVKPELPNSPSSTKQQPENVTTGTQAQEAPTQNQPTGTAAAQRGAVSGSMLSRPAGVAIAPEKQHRTRSFLIKMGFIAGAGVALGTVAALSMASPPKPPGAP
jgi:hypothetical protein